MQIRVKRRPLDAVGASRSRPRRALSKLWSCAGGALARVRASPWSPVLARAAAVLVAIAVLAWVGRVASASAGAPALAALAAADASPPPPEADGGGSGASAASIDASSPPRVVAPPSARGRATADDPVYLNHAGVEDLRRLPGVGPKRAEAIVALRQRIGRFQRVEELLRVRGVGRATLRKWRPLVRLDAPPAAAAPSNQDAGASP